MSHNGSDLGPQLRLEECQHGKMVESEKGRKKTKKRKQGRKVDPVQLRSLNFLDLPSERSKNSCRDADRSGADKTFLKRDAASAEKSPAEIRTRKQRRPIEHGGRD